MALTSSLLFAHATYALCLLHCACRYDGSEIVEQREVSLPDSVHSMQLAGTMAYIGLKQEYIAVDTNSGSLTQLFASRAPNTGCTAVPAASTGAAAAMAAAAAAAAAAEAGAAAAGGSGAAAAPGASPSATATAVAGVLLTRDAQSVLMGTDGKLSRRGSGVTWSTIPRLVAVSGPYAVAALEPLPGTTVAAAVAAGAAGAAGPAWPALEVRLLEPLSSSELVQRLEVGPAPAAAGAAAAGSGAGSSSGGSEGSGSREAAAGAPVATAAAGPGCLVVDVAAPSPAPDGSLFVGCKSSGALVRLVPAPSHEQVGSGWVPDAAGLGVGAAHAL